MSGYSMNSTRGRATSLIAAVGSSLFITLYSALGAEGVTSKKPAAELAELVKRGYELIVVERHRALQLGNLKYRHPLPLIVDMPALRVGMSANDTS